MCGIIGYIGEKRALPFLVKGLKDLEYRGYDSCGIALVEDGKLKVIKVKGEVANLVTETKGNKSTATIGIGHTRWATHGKPSVKNAHPHLDCEQKIAVVHNGIIENHVELKKELEEKGHVFRSETDTEILPHLIEEELKQKINLMTAVTNTLKRVVGAYGIVVLSSDFPDQIIVARSSSPLIVGEGKDENYLASDQPALVGYTNKLGSLKEGQIAKITKDKIVIKNLAGQSDRYQKIFIEDSYEAVSKGEYPHFMLKEIFEQPKVLADGLRGRFSSLAGVKLGGVEGFLPELLAASHLTAVACGGSFYTALVGKYYFQKIAEKPTLVENATDIVGSEYPWEKGAPVVFTSQSGETADLMTVLRKANKADVLSLGLTNIVGSSLARETVAGVYARAGFEVGVAATKTFSAQILVFLLMALMMEEKGENKKDKKLYKEISGLPELVEKTLKSNEEIQALAKTLKRDAKVFILGREFGYALALEAALKLKEIPYVPAEAIAAGELKHGPLALVDKKTRLLFLVPNDEHLSKNINSIEEAKARDGQITVITNTRPGLWKGLTDDVHFFPQCHSFLSPYPLLVWVQLLAYYLAVELGRSIDKPRNLAKSVTVE